MPEDINVDFELVHKVVEKAKRLFNASPTYNDIVKGQTLVNLEDVNGKFCLKTITIANGDSKITIMDNAIIAKTKGNEEKIILKFLSFEDFLSI